MKRLVIVLLLLFPLLTLSACEPQVYSGKIILEGQHTIATVDGDLVVLSGQVTLPVGSHVTGSVYLLSGELQADGAIGGSVFLMTGALTLGPHAKIQGDLKIGSGTLSRSPTATIGGQVTSETAMAVPLSPAWWNDQSVGGQLLWFLARTVLLAALAFLLARFVPQPIVRVSKAATQHPVISGAMGLLTLVVSLSLLVFMAFTIVLLPITLLGILLLGAAITYGWIALGLEIGAAWPTCSSGECSYQPRLSWAHSCSWLRCSGSATSRMPARSCSSLQPPSGWVPCSSPTWAGGPMLQRRTLFPLAIESRRNRLRVLG
jgi:hypothetical protein